MLHPVQPFESTQVEHKELLHATHCQLVPSLQCCAGQDCRPFKYLSKNNNIYNTFLKVIFAVFVRMRAVCLNSFLHVLFPKYK